MKVAELKQVVDANAAASVCEEIAAIRKEIQDSARETLRQMRIMFEKYEDRIAAIVEARVERRLNERIDLRIAKAEVRLERKFDRKYGKH